MAAAVLVCSPTDNDDFPVPAPAAEPEPENRESDAEPSCRPAPIVIGFDTS